MDMTRRTFVETGGAAAAVAMIADAGLPTMADEAAVQDAAAPEEADVIVIGAGAAGLAAAAEAGARGMHAIVVDAAADAGGATLYSSGFMLWRDDEFNASAERNDADLEPYLALDEEDFPEPWRGDLATLKEQMSSYAANGEPVRRFDSVECGLIDHHLRGAGTDRDGNAVSLDYAPLRAAFEQAPDILSWLGEDGFAMSGEFVAGRSGLPISHVGKPEGGSVALVEALRAKALAGGCDIRFGVRATRLLVEGGRVVGVVADSDGQSRELRAAAGIVVATGPYASNPALAAMYQNYGLGLSDKGGTTNPPANRGDGLIMAQRTGAAARDLQFLTTLMKPYHAMGSSADGNAMLNAGKLAVNSACTRFADESQSAKFQQAMNDQPDGLAYVVGDAETLAALGESETLEAMQDRGVAFVADTLAEVAQAAGLDPEALEAAVTEFNETCSAGLDDTFGRAELPQPVEEGPFFVGVLEMCYHLTFGGLVVDESGRVTGIGGEPIEGLYAAGSVLSGFEGKVHQSGACLTYVVYSGRLVGQLI